MVAMPAWPIALCHMSAKYTYKAYLPNEMLRITFKNLKQVSCWWMVSIATAIPTLIFAIVAAVFASGILSFISAGILSILAYANVEILPERRGWMFYPILAGVAIFIIAIIMWFIGILLSINGVFIMRLTGIFCYYNQATLDMGDKRVAGEPAGFWIRYLGYLVDLIVVGIFEFIAFCFFLAIKLLMIEIGIEDLIVTIASVEHFLIYPVIPIVYYVFSESGPGAGTLAKHALGIHVVTNEGKKPISRSQAITRFMVRFAGFFGLLMPFWDPEKRTMHDKSSKTKVVWKPENY